MAGANERSREIGRCNSCVFPRDLLQRFISNSAPEDVEEEDEEIELNLGLSLGGRFGVDKSSKLVRSSSSVVAKMPLSREQSHHQPVETLVGLTRTTSLPMETEEEWRKRKEMQTLRRMAAKRRRSEKLRGGSSIKPTEAVSNPGEGSRKRGRPLSSGLPRWSGKVNKGGGLLRQHSVGHDSLQVSVESGGGTGGGSFSSVSEFETKSHQASSEEARSLPLPQQQQEAMAKPNNGLRRLSSVDMKPPQGKGRNEMPSVFTKGPNGKRVDGILYRYGNGEEVKIMCICHGEFMSPADFVKHAGGPHVEHPLRHIVVNTSSPSNLF
ncbi:unnamed protein product [Eruca vesicaria subsp. sativa]|uniref:Ninja-family protein n=1 Tax=Eruca vesicaria subsp. sativa TaxID=29727 RepID=A0ABC8KYW9_ERUVS|nr:unnamed protein product [Eruca vesicaria subsp. sativa]